MAKQLKTTTEKRISKYPSDFGSHESMVDVEATKKIHGKDYNLYDLPSSAEVVLIGEHGQYTTVVSRLDNGLADPNRYCIKD